MRKTYPTGGRTAVRSPPGPRTTTSLARVGMRSCEITCLATCYDNKKGRKKRTVRMSTTNLVTVARGTTSLEVALLRTTLWGRPLRAEELLVAVEMAVVISVMIGPTTAEVALLDLMEATRKVG